VRLAWSSVRDVGYNLQAGHYPSLTAPNLQHIGYSVQPGHYSSLPAPNLQPTANQERNDQRGNGNHSRELLMMGVVVPETC